MIGRPTGTRYRMLETIRQYGAEQMDRIGEEHVVRARHLRWCAAVAARLEAGEDPGAGFDEVADDLRAALGWATHHPTLRAEAHDRKTSMNQLCISKLLQVIDAEMVVVE